MADALTPEAHALLDAIAGSESNGAWNVVYGGRKFSDFSAHPRIYTTINSGPNAGRKSSAAGKFQITATTYDRVAPKLGIKDFSPESQQKIAWYLAQEKYGPNLQSALESGDAATIKGVAKKLSGVWTSLPSGSEQGVSGSRFVERFNAAANRPVPPANIPGTVSRPAPSTMSADTAAKRQPAASNAAVDAIDAAAPNATYFGQPGVEYGYNSLTGDYEPKTPGNSYTVGQLRPNAQLGAGNSVAPIPAVMPAGLRGAASSPRRPNMNTGGFSQQVFRYSPEIPLPAKTPGTGGPMLAPLSAKPGTGGPMLPQLPAPQAKSSNFLADMMAEGDRNRQLRVNEGVDPNDIMANLAWSTGNYQTPARLNSGTSTAWMKDAPSRSPGEYIGGAGGADIGGQVSLPHNVVPQGAAAAMEQAKTALASAPPTQPRSSFPARPSVIASNTARPSAAAPQVASAANFWSDAMAEGDRNRQQRAIEGVDPNNPIDNLSWSLGLRTPPASLGSGTSTAWGNSGSFNPGQAKPAYQVMSPLPKTTLDPAANMRGTNRTPGIEQFIPQTYKVLNPAYKEVPALPTLPEGAMPNMRGTNRTPVMVQADGSVPQYLTKTRMVANPAYVARPPAKIPLSSVAKIPQRIEHSPLGYAVGNWWDQTPAGRIGNFITGKPQAPMFGGLFDGLFGAIGDQFANRQQVQRSSPIPPPKAPAALSKSPAVAAFQKQGMTPSQAYAAASASALRPTNAEERSQSRQSAAESEARALNYFSG